MTTGFTVFYSACPTNMIVYNNSLNITCHYDGPDFQEEKGRQLLVLLPSFIMTAVLMLLGLPGNLTVMLVYIFKMDKTSSRRFFIALAGCDFINCIVGIPIELSLLSNFLTFDRPMLCSLSRFASFFLNNTSACLLTAIAVDRYKRVRYPLRPPMAVGIFRKACIVGVIFSFLCALPSVFIYGTKTTIINVYNKKFTYIVTKTCHIDDNANLVLQLAFSLYLLVVTMVAFIVLATIYTMIARVLVKRQHSFDSFALPGGPQLPRRASITILTPYHPPVQARQSSNFIFNQSNKRHHSITCLDPNTSVFKRRRNSDSARLLINGRKIRAGKTTLIMFTVTIVFMISFIPHLALVNLRYLKPEFFTQLSPFMWSLYHFGIRSYLLNSAVNPLIYCFMNAAFRGRVKTSIKDLLHKCKHRFW